MQLVGRRQEAVPQDLVIAVMIGLIHSKPVLVTSPFQLSQVEAQIEDIGVALTGKFDHDSSVINCSSEIPWSVLEPRLLQCSQSVLLMKRIDKLSMDTQLQLGYALMEQGPSIKKFMSSSALVFTSRTLPEKLHPFLRRQILLREDIDFLDEECLMVELPDVRAQLETTGQIEQIRSVISKVTIVPELLRYIQDILMFIRTHRLCRVGVRPQAAADFELLVRTLCVLEGRAFATPVVIRQAAKLALPVHVRLCSAEDEPSLQYGGDIATVRAWIKVWDEDVLVDSVLEEVPVPG